MGAYGSTDNVYELTTRTTFEGWKSMFIEWLKWNWLNTKGSILVFFVGGRNKDKYVLAN